MMRDATSLLLAVVLALLGLVGCGASKPEPGPNPVPTFSLASSFTRTMNDTTLHTLPNGLTLLHRHTKSNSIVGVVVYVRLGAAEEDPERNGATNLMMRVLTKGTRTRTSEQIAEQVARLGASLSASAAQDYCTVSLQCVEGDFEEGLDLLADVLLNPTFPPEQIDLERKRVLASIRMGEDQNSTVASKRLRRELFGGHPYGRPVEGTPDTLAAVTPQDVHGLHRDHFVASNMVFSVVGNVEFDRVRGALAERLGAPMAEKRQRFQVDKQLPPAGSRAEVFKPSEQAFILLGHVTFPAGHADEPALEVAATILGGGMSSRLFHRLRDERGLAYAVGASTSFLRTQGMMTAYIGTSPANADCQLKALADAAPGTRRCPCATCGLWEQIELLREEPPGAEELQRAKNYIAGNYLRAHERNMGRAGYLAYWFVTGRAPEYDEEYVRAIEGVTSRDVLRVANRYFVNPTVVIVRPASDQNPAGAP